MTRSHAALLAVVALSVLPGGCRSTSRSRYVPSRAIVASIPPDVAARALREQIAAMKGAASTRPPFEPVDADVEGLLATWRPLGDDDTLREAKLRWNGGMFYRAEVHGTGGGASYSVYVFAQLDGRTHQTKLHWTDYQSRMSEASRREAVETCIDALESLGVAREPDPVPGAEAN